MMTNINTYFNRSNIGFDIGEVLLLQKAVTIYPGEYRCEKNSPIILSNIVSEESLFIKFDFIYIGKHTGRIIENFSSVITPLFKDELYKNKELFPLELPTEPFEINKRIRMFEKVLTPYVSCFLYDYFDRLNDNEHPSFVPYSPAPLRPAVSWYQ